MNTLNKLASSFQKVGSLLPNNPLAQEAINYGAGAALGIGGQQLMNWATPGADPNPLLSGLMYAPIGAKAFRGGVPNGAIAKAVLDASNIAAYGGAATSIYNVATDGTDYDNNLISAGVGTLGAIAPIAYSLLRGKNKSSTPMPTARPNRESSPSGGIEIDFGDMFNKMAEKHKNKSTSPSAANYYETPSATYPYNQEVRPFRRG